MVLRSVAVKQQKMLAIVKQQNPVFSNGERQNLRVRHGRVGISSIQRGQHVVPEPSKLSDNWQWNVLV
jgi:hypothetical protein